MINLSNLNTLHDNNIYHPCPYFAYNPIAIPSYARQMQQPTPNPALKDSGPEPFVINIEDATEENTMFRTTLWTGEHLQLTLMSLEAGEDIGLEIHEDHDQFIRVESGQGLVQMGDAKDNLDFQERLKDDYIVIIPAGKWHNLTNTGNMPLKLYSIYAPVEHAKGTVHETKAIADAAEEEYGY